MKQPPLSFPSKRFLQEIPGRYLMHFFSFIPGAQAIEDKSYQYPRIEGRIKAEKKSACYLFQTTVNPNGIRCDGLRSC